jgi:hypothetical protein
MRARFVIAGVAVAAVVLAGLTGLWFAGPAPAQKIFAGTYSSDTDLRVTNLTIVGGHVRVGYALDVLYEPAVKEVSSETLRCGLVDTSRQLDFFAGSSTSASAGSWTHLEFASNYDLPDITLGVRCSPSVDGVASVTFRDVTLTAEPL